MKLWNVYLLTFENGAVEALETAIEETVTWRIRTTLPAGDHGRGARRRSLPAVRSVWSGLSA
jgi:hypothetical protein